jgi:hypothetical protein
MAGRGTVAVFVSHDACGVDDGPAMMMRQKAHDVTSRVPQFFAVTTLRAPDRGVDRDSLQQHLPRRARDARCREES